MNDLCRLKDKLCRELAQSERSATVHTRREARRLGEGAPANALVAIAEHAEAQRPRFEALRGSKQRLGMRAGSFIGRALSRFRQLLLDKIVDVERSYRGTLLGLHHGVGIVRLLAEVASRDGDRALYEFLQEWLAVRRELVERAEQALAWFAQRPSRSVQSGLRQALQDT